MNGSAVRVSIHGIDGKGVERGGAHLLDKLGEVAAVALQLAVLVVDDVRAHRLQEVAVVAHNHRRDARHRHEVVHEPLHVDDVQVVGRLVEQQDVGLLQDGARERELHLPAAGQRADLAALQVLREADLLHSDPRASAGCGAQ